MATVEFDLEKAAIKAVGTLFGYTNMAARTKNPVLAELLRRIARIDRTMSRLLGMEWFALLGLRAAAA